MMVVQRAPPVGRSGRGISKRGSAAGDMPRRHNHDAMPLKKLRTTVNEELKRQALLQPRPTPKELVLQVLQMVQAQWRQAFKLPSLEQVVRRARAGDGHNTNQAAGDSRIWQLNVADSTG